MLQKSLISIVVANFLFLCPLFALSLKESIVEVLNTNPVVQERLKNYRATQQDLNVAEAGYYPQVDVDAYYGYNDRGRIKDDQPSRDWNHYIAEQSFRDYSATLTLTQNLFDGFGTTNQVDYQEARILAAAYKYLEVANDEAYKIVNAYLNLLKSEELEKIALQNVQINEEIFFKVKDLFDSGLTTESEVKKIESALSLSRSNLVVAKHNFNDNKYKFKRIFGRLPDITNMEKPHLDILMPESKDRAVMYAIKYNPSIIVAKYDVKVQQALWKERKKSFYPKVDLEFKQALADNDGLSIAPNDAFTAKVVMSYNLFRGGADRAIVQQQISKINQEIEIERTLKRETIEGMDLSWSAYRMLEEQVAELKQYSKFAEKTLDLYKEEYDLGRRTLLDLLSAQNDVINSRSEIITAGYNQLFAQYRILDAMGLLVTAINGSSREFTSRVNLFGDEKAHEILDTVPVKRDVDNDRIADDIDLCDNSLEANNIMPNGCRKVDDDIDFDGVPNRNDKCPKTAIGLTVDRYGCEANKDVDSDLDGVYDSKDSCPNTPKGYEVDENGCTQLVTLQVNFQDDSVSIPEKSFDKIMKFAKFLEENTDLKANIVGHTSRTSVSNEEYNLKLSKNRADAVKKMLIDQGIDADRLSSDGKGFLEPIADNTTKEGRAENRRVEIELTRISIEEEIE